MTRDLIISLLSQVVTCVVCFLVALWRMKPYLDSKPYFSPLYSNAPITEITETS